MSVIWDKAVVRGMVSLMGSSQPSPASLSEGHRSHAGLEMAVEKILGVSTSCVTIFLTLGNPRPFLIDHFLLNIPFVFPIIIICGSVDTEKITHRVFKT